MCLATKPARERSPADNVNMGDTPPPALLQPIHRTCSFRTSQFAQDIPCGSKMPVDLTANVHQAVKTGITALQSPVTRLFIW